MPTLKETPVSTQRARMRTLQHQMPRPTNPLDPIFRRLAPSQENHPLHPLRRDGVDDLLREFLPALVGVRVCGVGADRQAGVEEEHTAVGPGG